MEPIYVIIIWLEFAADVTRALISIFRAIFIIWQRLKSEISNASVVTGKISNLVPAVLTSLYGTSLSVFSRNSHGYDYGPAKTKQTVIQKPGGGTPRNSW